MLDTMPDTAAVATPAVIRIGYLTTDMTNFRKARELGQLDGFVVDLVPPDAPTPEPGAFHGLLADFAPSARHTLGRKMFLNRLVRIAKEVPLVVFDQTMNYPESSALRAAGIKWFPVPTARAFPVLLARARVMSAMNSPSPAPAAAAAKPEDRSDAGSEVLSTAG